MPLFLNLDWLFDGLAFSRVLSGVLPIVGASLAEPATARSLFDNLPVVTTSPPPSAPVLPNNIDWGNFLTGDLGTQFNAIVATVNSTVNSLVTEYTDIFADLSQWIGTLPELNFANFLTIDVGNIFNDPAYNQLLVFGNSLSDTGSLSQLLGGLETVLGVDIVPGNGLPTNAGLVQAWLSPGGLSAAIEPLLGALTADAWRIPNY
jgi:hypothetical protein